MAQAQVTRAAASITTAGFRPVSGRTRGTAAKQFGNWNNFFLPFVMLPDSSQYPAQIGLNNLLTSSSVVNTSAGLGNQIMRPELALAAPVTILPVLLVFLFSQRALVSGMLAGATKE